MTAENSPQPLKFPEASYGQKAVGLSFNPSGLPSVHLSKQYFAQIIDQLYSVWGKSVDPEHKALAMEAIRQAQTAQMWATKVLTTKVY